MKRRKDYSRTVVILALLLVCSLGIGCEIRSSQLEQPGGEKTVQGDIELAESIKRQVEKKEVVEETTAIVLDEDVSIGIKVTGFQRLRLKQIRGEVHSLVKEMLPDDYVLHVTTDKRLFADLQKIEEEMRETNGRTTPETRERVMKINQDMQG